MLLSETSICMLLLDARVQKIHWFPILLMISDFASLTLREYLRTHKVFTKDQCFYPNYHKFSIKSYVLDVY